MRSRVAVSSLAALAGLVGVVACDTPGGDAASSRSSTSSSAVVASSSATSSSSSSSSRVRLPVPETIVAQHILVGYKGVKRVSKTITRTKAEAKARAAEVLAKLRAGAEFEDMVKEYSDDPGSIERQGLLGKFHRADLDPAFAAAAFNLQVEEVSEVVETPFGFHIIKRTQ